MKSERRVLHRLREAYPLLQWLPCLAILHDHASGERIRIPRPVDDRGIAQAEEWLAFPLTEHERDVFPADAPLQERTITLPGSRILHVFLLTFTERNGNPLTLLLGTEKDGDRHDAVRRTVKELERRLGADSAAKKTASPDPLKDMRRRLAESERDRRVLKRDIARWKKAADALREKSRMLDLAGDAIIIWSTGRIITYWNQGAQRTYGWSAREANGKILHELLQAVYPRPLDEIYRRLLDEGRWEGEILHRRKDGERIVVFSRWTLWRDAAGELSTVLEINQDITERKRAEEGILHYRRRLETMVAERTAKLTEANERLKEEIEERKQAEAIVRESEARMRAFFESSLVGTVLGDFDGAVLQCNDEYLRIVGYDREDMEAGRLRWTEITPPEYRELDRKMLEEARSSGTGASRPYEKEYLRKNGTRIPVLLGFVLVGDNRDRILAFAMDLTERKALEEQLLHSQRLEAVGRLAGGVAHDFNNLLTVVNGYSDMLLTRVRSDDPNRMAIEQIRQSGERASGLIRQLLAFSRKQVLQPRSLDMNEVVSNMEKLLRRLIGEDVELVVRRPSGLSRVKADPVQVEQVIVNLAVNARDAMPQGGRLSIELRNIEIHSEYAPFSSDTRAGCYVQIAVTDTGIGMDEHTRSRIFEPFFTTKEKTKGTGLGLATVYGIVKQSGGHIWVYSEPGKGTTFKVHFPCDHGEGAQEAPEKEKEAAGGSETILVVEDEDVVRGLVREVLRVKGYAVLEASNGEEALTVLRNRRRPVDLVLTDVVMPGMSGPDLIEKLRKIHPDAKVLFMSGYTENESVRQGMPGADTDFLPKPFTHEMLAARVRALLDAPSQRKKAG